METEKTIVFVKPEAQILEQELLKYFDELGKVDYITRIQLNARKISVVYPAVGKAVEVELHRHLLNTNVLTLVICGDTIVNRVCDAIGWHINPEECGVHSLRYIFETIYHKSKPVILGDGSGFYYRNYLHRARTTEEAQQQIRHLFNGSYVPTI